MASQHDLDLENATGAAFRADLNLALKAISQKQWGPATPPTPLAYQDYVDTSGSKPKLKIYDGASHVVMAALDTVNHLWLPVIGGGNGTIASATTTDLATIDESGISVTGTTTITALGTVPKGQIKRLTFAASLTLTHNGTSLILPGAKNIQTQAGDTCLVESLGAGNWRAYAFTPAAALPNAGLNAEETVASAATTDIGAALSNIVKITGTTTITSLGSTASLQSPIYFIRFTGALLLTHNGTSLIIPGAANITTAAGDSAVAQYLGSGNWKILLFTPAAGNVSATYVDAAVAGAKIAISRITTTGTTAGSITGLSAAAKQFRMIVNGCALLTGTDSVWFRAGDSGGFKTSGYNAVESYNQNVNGAGVGTIGTTLAYANAGTALVYGHIDVNLVDAATYKYQYSGILHPANAAFGVYFSGSFTLTGLLDRLQIVASTGSNNFGTMDFAVHTEF